MNKNTPEHIHMRGVVPHVEICRKNVMPLCAGSVGLLRLCMMAAMLGLLLSSARAQTLSWDASGTSPTSPKDGSATWSTTGTNWSNGTSDSVWTTGDTAEIGNNNGAAGTITVGTVSVANIIFNTPGSGAYTLNGGTITLTSGTITDNNTLGVTTINSVIAGSVGLTTAGSGTLTVGGNNTYSGTTTINAGSTLEVNNNNALTGNVVDNGNLVFISGVVGPGFVAGGTISGGGNVSGTAGNLDLLYNMNVGGSISLSATASAGFQQGLQFGGQVGNGTLTWKASSITLQGDLGFYTSGNSGNMVLDTSAYNGPINLNITITRPGSWYPFGSFSANSGTGTLTWSGSDASNGNQTTPITLTGAINFSSNFLCSTAQTMTLNATEPSTVSGTFSGPLSLIVGGSSTLAISSNNSYTGTTSISAGGTLQLGNGGTTGKLSTSSAITDNGTLAINRSNAVSQGADFTGSPIIGTGGFTQAGTGTTTLTAANTYSGTTRVTAGTLVVNGSLTNSPVNVAGGTLSGTGTISQNVIVGTGLGAPSSSIIAPSAGGGVAAQSILNMNGNLTLNSDAAFQFKLDSMNLTNDALIIGGTLTLTNGPTLTGSDINNASDLGNSFIIAQANGGITGTFAGDPQGADITIGSNTYAIDYTAAGSTEIVLTAVAIPEPETWAGILTGFGMLAVIRRFRRGGME